MLLRYINVDYVLQKMVIYCSVAKLLDRKHNDYVMYVIDNIYMHVTYICYITISEFSSPNFDQIPPYKHRNATVLVAALFKS